MTDPVKWVNKKLGYTFQSPDLLDQALTHRSLTANNLKNNERLEFLGDAVLDLAIATSLYDQKNIVDEGELSRQRAALVRGESLARIATQIGLGDQIRLGGGEARSGGHQRRSILADALEALIGAIYLDGGYVAAAGVIEKLFSDRIAGLPAIDDLKDAKTSLQELLQARGSNLPDYRVTDESGPPHDREFAVICEVVELGIEVTGTGRSRQRAEQQAAATAIEIIRQQDNGTS